MKLTFFIEIESQWTNVDRAVSLETLGLEVSKVSTNFPVSSLDTFSPSIETFNTEKKLL
jgi:hypothetical protein